MKQRLTIDNFPVQAGLMNAGGQAMIPENALWETAETATGLDGRAYKRPGLEQWGQTLKEPSLGGVALTEIFSDTSQIEQSNDPLVPFVIDDTLKITSTTKTSDGLTLWSRTDQPNDGTCDTLGKTDLRMMFKANGALPAQSASTSLPRGFGVGVRLDTPLMTQIPYHFLFLKDAIYYYNGTNFVSSLANVDDGRWHILQFSLSATASPGTVTAKIYVDEVLRDTVTVVSFVGLGIFGRRFYLSGRTVETATYEVEVDFVQVRSDNDKIIGVPVTALQDWTSNAPRRKHLLIVAGNTLYDDRDHAGVFRAIDVADSAELTVFYPWLDELLIANPRQPLRRWTGTGQPVAEMTATRPQNVYLVASHQARVAVVSENTPLTVHFSAANDITDWTTEDSVSPSGESFFLPIPDARGKRVVGILGDFYGQCIIWTEESAFAMIGSSVDTYVLRRISQATGLMGPRAFDAAAKDCIFGGTRGVHSVATVQEYGDLAASDMSRDIRNLWQHDNQFGLKRVIPNYRSSVVHAPELARTYLAAQIQGDSSRPAKIMEFNHDTGRWSGPWSVECEAIDFVLLGVPGIPSLLVGDTAGRVNRVGSDRRSDLGSTSYGFRFRSARLDGRSIDQSLRRRDKHWGELRLFVLPRGARGLELTWVADGHKRTETLTVSQNKYNEGLLDTTFVLDKSEIVDSEKIAMITQDLDVRSKWLEFTVEAADADGDAVIVGFQVDLTAAQDAKENA